jgi:hypothetical protein
MNACHPRISARRARVEREHRYIEHTHQEPTEPALEPRYRFMGLMLVGLFAAEVAILLWLFVWR